MVQSIFRFHEPSNGIIKKMKANFFLSQRISHQIAKANVNNNKKQKIKSLPYHHLC